MNDTSAPPDVAAVLHGGMVTYAPQADLDAMTGPTVGVPVAVPDPGAGDP